MINLFKYRKLGIVMLITMIVAFLLCVIALWNFILASQAKNGGWILVFLFFLFGSGAAMFLLVYRLSDHEVLETYVDSILKEEKALLGGTEDKAGEEIHETEKMVDETTAEDAASQILSGIDARNAADFCEQLLKRTCKQLDFIQGICYARDKKARKFVPAGTFALNGRDPEPFDTGDGFQGEAVASRQIIRINDIPEHYFEAASGLGTAKPRHILFVPISYRNQGIALIEAGTFTKPEEITERILQQIADKSGKLLHDLMMGKK